MNEEFLPELRGPKWRRIIREMSEGDPVVGGILFAIEMLCRRVEWRVEAADESVPQAVEIADFVETCRHDLSSSWSDLIAEILTLLPYGWSYHEIVYKLRMGWSDDATHRSKYDDGRVGWRKLPGRAQDTLAKWEFDEDGGIRGMWQTREDGAPAVFIPIEKSLLFRTSVERGNPEGRSILRRAYRPWYFRTHLERIEAIGIERDLAGLPVATVPPEIMAADAGAPEKALLASIKQILTGIRRDEQDGVIYPAAYDDAGHKLYELTLLTSGGSRQFDTDKIVNRYDSRMAMSILADFILLGHEKVGSFALADTKTSLFAYAIGAWLDVIADTFNAHAIPRLVRLNGWDDRLCPRLVPGRVEEKDLEELGNYFQRLASAGMVLFPNPVLERYLLGAAGAPTVLADEAELIP